MMQKNVLIGVLVIVVIIVGAFLLSGKQETQAPTTEELGGTKTETPPTQTQTAPTAPKSQTTVQPQTQTLPVATVRYTKSGFSPTIVTISKGGSVQFINDTTDLMWVASAPHPTHTAYPAFDEKRGVGQGGVYTFRFTEVGDWYFHNHLNPVHKGQVIVKQQ